MGVDVSVGVIRLCAVGKVKGKGVGYGLWVVAYKCVSERECCVCVCVKCSSSLGVFSSEFVRDSKECECLCK